jgi:hypothetical protein
MKAKDLKTGHWYLTTDPPHNGAVWLVFVHAINKSDMAKYTHVQTNEDDVFEIFKEISPGWLSVKSLAKCLSNDITELFYSPLPPHPFFETDMLDYIKI